MYLQHNGAIAFVKGMVVLFAGGFPLTMVGGLPSRSNDSLTDCSMSDHLLSHLAFSAVIVSGFRRGTELSQFGYSYNYMGQTETPRREVWSVSSFSRRCWATSHVNMWRASLTVRLSLLCRDPTPSVSTWWGICEIKAIGPLILPENYPDRFRSSLWLHFLTMQKHCQSWSMDRHPSSNGTS